MESQRRWIGRSEAMERLGVKSQTLYAYVSRGRITARQEAFGVEPLAAQCGAPPLEIFPVNPHFLGFTQLERPLIAGGPSVRDVNQEQ